MRRGAGTAALQGLLAVVVFACALPVGAAAEPASQPTAPVAGGLDVGKSHACALLPGARVRCWGYGGDGVLGYANRNTIGDDETPAAAGPVDLGAGRTATALSAGSNHTCALLDDGTVRCWGFGGDGRLGYGNTNTVGDDEAPGAVGPVELGGPAKAIAAGRAHTCAVLDDGTVRCWGYGADGRLGYGNEKNVGDDETPASAGKVQLGVGRTATAITAGDSHTCALLDNGRVLCWGYGGNAELGNFSAANVGDNETPDKGGTVLLGTRRTAVAISAGIFFTCALLDNGTVTCWGYGGNGRLGTGNTDIVSRPFDSPPIDLGAGRTAVAISAGSDHACALLNNGNVRCWGYGGNGRLGYGNTDSIGDDETPGSVGPVDLGRERTAVAVSAGASSTCARLDDGSVRCWGEGSSGRLGYCNTSTIGDDETPGPIGSIDLGVPGGSGAGCASTPPPPSVPAGPGPAGRPPPPKPDEMLAALTAQKIRARALRTCLRRASSQAGSGVRRSARTPVGAMRRLARRAALRRRLCLTRYGRTPGRVTTISARATGRHTVVLTFHAAGTDRTKPPAARAYVVKQSRHRIATRRDFDQADTLCKGHCGFNVTQVGAKITLTITRLRLNRIYYYAVAARDNVSARTGPRSRTVAARTPVTGPL